MRITSQQELNAVLRLEGPERFRHFVKRVADEERAWGLWSDGWMLMAKPDGAHTSIGGTTSSGPGFRWRMKRCRWCAFRAGSKSPTVVIVPGSSLRAISSRRSARRSCEMLGAMRAAGVEPTPPWDDPDVDGGIRDVSARVAEMWAWISF